VASGGGRGLIQVGDIIHIEEADYCYGRGPLTVRVTAIGANLTRFPKLEWVRLRGVELRSDGSDGEQRLVLVRVKALRGEPPADGLPRRHDRPVDR
jgi:hypothetical protein